eukprot:365906-Chlamydomonas_euryale.AAC.9
MIQAQKGPMCEYEGRGITCSAGSLHLPACTGSLTLPAAHLLPYRPERVLGVSTGAEALYNRTQPKNWDAEVWRVIPNQAF